ncbi:MAG: class I SAM-dependent methyltransferase [Acidimicrobiaceae bacterium]|nr:class I SAM-dependent methyltransferase [Acidimicrobiaceae bacterium]MCY4280412.1 class I SAM-dependent methyltransferase [Acidimicrobiaceae bacterium]MCY4293998.1 class I SAM-dependent methyltransferase [Acidimicrobiaceae bacterium]
MSSQHSVLSEAVADYIETVSTGPDELQRELMAVTARLGEWSNMQINSAQGSFMTILTTLTRPRFAVEVGTFTGYSALAVAKALPRGGRLLCCDVSEEWTRIARHFWERAGVADCIDLRIGPALDTLRSLPAEPTIDMAFIDADKSSYVAYYEEILSRLSESGMILVDNTLKDGTVTDSDNTDTGTVEMRSFNAHVSNDDRVDVVLIPIADGLSMITRRIN